MGRHTTCPTVSLVTWYGSGSGDGSERAQRVAQVTGRVIEHARAAKNENCEPRSSTGNCSAKNATGRPGASAHYSEWFRTPNSPQNTGQSKLNERSVGGKSPIFACMKDLCANTSSARASTTQCLLPKAGATPCAKRPTKRLS